MKFASVVLGVSFAVPLFLGTSLLMDVEMAATPLSPPAGSPLDIQYQGEAHLRMLKDEANRKRNAPVAVSSSKENDTQDIRLKEYQAAQDWISIVEQKLSREVSQAEWRIKRETKKRDDESPMDWVNRMTHEFNVYPHPATEIVFTESLPCKDPAFTADACVGQDTFAGHPTAQNMEMYLTSRAIGDIYVLMHEIAHTKGILDDCMADNYSRSITGLPGGHYCS